ncbi:tail fiber domain-containing protein [Candidatus Woesearchaeota archaeon]|nr:tail fiber domain-containing protein [Candidatus Woesearchaeota archaeon]
MRRILLIGILMVLLAVFVSAADIIVKAGGLNVQGLTVDGNTLFIDSVNNKVGIGTVNPTQQLDVIGKIKSDGLIVDTETFFVDNVSDKVGIGVIAPSGKLTLFSPESINVNDFYTSLTKSGINIVSNYTSDAETPGIFWSTDNNNPTKPKAGINIQETGTGTSMFFHVSDNYVTGITRTPIIIKPTGEVDISGNLRAVAGDFYDLGTNTVSGVQLCVAGTGQIGTCGSDQRLKDNIAIIDFGLDVLNRLKPVNFDFISGDKNQAGFIAQDVQQVLPGLVKASSGDDMLSIKTDGILAYAVKAIQELSRENVELKARIGALEKR